MRERVLVFYREKAAVRIYFENPTVF